MAGPLYLDNRIPTARVHTHREKYRQDYIVTALQCMSVPTGKKTLWRSEKITGQEGVWRVADEIFMNGGESNSYSDQQKSQRPYPKGKPPKLLQQSGGALRSEKRRLHL